MSHDYDKYRASGTKLFDMLYPLNFVLSFVLGAFDFWNWNLAFRGFTSVEFWGMKLPDSTGQRYDFSGEDFIDNFK